MKYSFIKRSLALLVFVSVFSMSYANENVIYLKKGDSTSIPCPSCTAVGVDNPNISDVAVDEDSVVLSAIEPGTTSVTVSTKDGDNVYKVVVWEDDVPFVANQVRSLLKVLGLSEKVKVKEDKKAGKVYLLGTIYGEEDALSLEKLLNACPSPVVVNLVSEKESHKVVEVKVNIAEVEKNAADQFGVDWPSSVGVSTDENDSDETDEESNGRTFAQAMRFNKWTHNDVSWMLNMLETENKGRVLATPSILATSGKEASILVGGEIPVLMYDDNEPKVEFRPYGIILKILPNVVGNKIDVNLECEVSEVDSSNRVVVTLAGEDDDQRFSVPAFTKRETKTQIILNNGESIVIGGLLKNTKAKTSSGLPGLGKLPVLGALFSSKDFQSGRTELMIALTPIIRKTEDSEEGVAKSDSGQRGAAAAYLKGMEDISPIERYKRKARSLIAKSLEYPDYVKEKGISGTVLLSLHIARSGKVLGVRVKASSGSKVLDRLAIMLIRDIGRFAPFPGDLSLEDLWIDVPIVYQS